MVLIYVMRSCEWCCMDWSLSKLDLCSYAGCVCLMCRYCLRRSMINDGLELGSRGTEVSRLSSRRNWVPICQNCYAERSARERCMERLVDVWLWANPGLTNFLARDSPALISPSRWQQNELTRAQECGRTNHWLPSKHSPAMQSMTNILVGRATASNQTAPVRLGIDGWICLIATASSWLRWRQHGMETNVYMCCIYALVVC